MKNIHVLPKEEQKQHLIDIMRGDEELGLYEEPKQETLEEAAENYADKQSDISMRQNPLEYSKSGEELWYESKVDFIAGAKWQAERMYSKEDLRAAWMAAKNSSDFNEWFEQFKKK